MDISKYTSFFHDGSIMQIDHIGDNIDFILQSAEVDKEDLSNDISLTKRDTILGKLHVLGVKKIIIDNMCFFGKLIKTHDCADIFDFEILNSNVEFKIIWINFPVKLKSEKFSTIKIEAEKIYWENIPDLIDQFS